jgi:hypothetical protein
MICRDTREDTKHDREKGGVRKDSTLSFETLLAAVYA